MLKFSPEYWLVHLPFKPSNIGYKEWGALQAERREKLKAAGFKTEYRFPLKQKGLANAMVARIEKKTGVAMECGKAFNL